MLLEPFTMRDGERLTGRDFRQLLADPRRDWQRASRVFLGDLLCHAGWRRAVARGVLLQGQPFDERPGIQTLPTDASKDPVQIPALQEDADERSHIRVAGVLLVGLIGPFRDLQGRRLLSLSARRTKLRQATPNRGYLGASHLTGPKRDTKRDRWFGRRTFRN